MFNSIPNPARGGPTHMINHPNTGRTFLLGTYDQEREWMNVTTPPQNIESGCLYAWAAAGWTEDNRLLTAAWVRPNDPSTPSVISLIREILYDHNSKQLISRPVVEYAKLRNWT